jgi:hypothetical protein
MYIRSGDDYCTDINHRIRRVQWHDDSPFQAHFSRATGLDLMSLHIASKLVM